MYAKYLQIDLVHRFKIIYSQQTLQRNKNKEKSYSN